MRLWNRLLVGCAALLFLGLAAEAAHATSMHGCARSGSQGDVFNPGEVESGGLLFHNFSFHSPACKVDPDDLEIDIVGRDVTISGDITLTGRGWAKFYVSYEVTVIDPTVDPLINGASLALDASVHAPAGAVFASKRVIGERPDKPAGHRWNDHGWGHLGWGLLHKFPDHGRPGGKTLASLKTAEWDVNWGCLCDFGWDDFCSGEIEFDEKDFDPQESVKVIDAVWIKAFGRHSNVEFRSTTNHFSVVPEPATAAMLALGLFGLAIVGRHV